VAQFYLENQLVLGHQFYLENPEILVVQFYLETRSHLVGHRQAQMVLEIQSVLVVHLEVQMVLGDLVYQVPKLQHLTHQWLINNLAIHQL
jgi:hypothetical protein